ncbi:hypothetical protein CEXT_128711 [Caerostris extrusa]|uniref:Uncharacterized protein n=1 Tax=Caerostris extrusa TaxID=172846 RepID=A0AAV4V617_CAEEX|nr:hypothetical protein CEXT_128711 [Caerostris extrusa]
MICRYYILTADCNYESKVCGSRDCNLFVFMAAWRQRNDAIAISKAAIVPQLSGGIVVRRFGGGPIQLFPNPELRSSTSTVSVPRERIQIQLSSSKKTVVDRRPSARDTQPQSWGLRHKDENRFYLLPAGRRDENEKEAFREQRNDIN